MENTKSGGPGPGRGWGNRTWGNQRPGTRAYAFRYKGWSAFGHCPKCDVNAGEACQRLRHSEHIPVYPHDGRKMVKA